MEEAMIHGTYLIVWTSASRSLGRFNTRLLGSARKNATENSSTGLVPLDTRARKYTKEVTFPKNIKDLSQLMFLHRMSMHLAHASLILWPDGTPDDPTTTGRNDLRGIAPQPPHL